MTQSPLLRIEKDQMVKDWIRSWHREVGTNDRIVRFLEQKIKGLGRIRDVKML